MEGEVLCDALNMDGCSPDAVGDELCHSSCKACVKTKFAYACITCADSSLEPAWRTSHGGEEFPFGYCVPCESQKEALEMCLSSNAETCPSVEYLIDALEPEFEFESGQGDFVDASFPEDSSETEADKAVSNYEIGLLFREVRNKLCNPIVALVSGLTVTGGGYPDCPCSPQLYEQLYCLEQDRIGTMSNDGRLFLGKPFEDQIPPTSSNPREEVCGDFSHQPCTTADIDPEMVGCVTPQCTILPDCECVKECKTCGLWSSQEKISYNDGSKKAGDPLTSCMSCRNEIEVSGWYFNKNGAGHCYGSSAPVPSFTVGAMISSMVMMMFLSLP